MEKEIVFVSNKKAKLLPAIGLALFTLLGGVERANAVGPIMMMNTTQEADEAEIIKKINRINRGGILKGHNIPHEAEVEKDISKLILNTIRTEPSMYFVTELIEIAQKYSLSNDEIIRALYIYFIKSSIKVDTYLYFDQLRSFYGIAFYSKLDEAKEIIIKNSSLRVTDTEKLFHEYVTYRKELEWSTDFELYSYLIFITIFSVLFVILMGILSNKNNNKGEED